MKSVARLAAEHAFTAPRSDASGGPQAAPPVVKVVARKLGGLKPPTQISVEPLPIQALPVEIKATPRVFLVMAPAPVGLANPGNVGNVAKGGETVSKRSRRRAAPVSIVYAASPAPSANPHNDHQVHAVAADAIEPTTAPTTAPMPSFAAELAGLDAVFAEVRAASAFDPCDPSDDAKWQRLLHKANVLLERLRGHR